MEALIQVGFAKKQCVRDASPRETWSPVCCEKEYCVCVCNRINMLRVLVPKVIHLQGNMLPDVYCPRFQIDKYGYIGYSALVFTLIMSEIIVCKTCVTIIFLRSFSIFF